MSLIVSWITYDSRYLSSAYIVSDSRVSWSESITYDGCRKTFFTKNYPELIAYCGDVLFPSLLITSIIEAIDNGMIFNAKDNAIQRYGKFKKYLFNEFHKYPKAKVVDSFELLYLNKDTTNELYPRFYAYSVSWKQNIGFRSKKINIPLKSGLLYVMGSGQYEFKKKYEDFQKYKNRGTSRNIFQCFAHLLLEIKDPHCGGAPQLVGLYRKPRTNGFPFGVIFNRRRFYNGLNIGTNVNNDVLEWRNKFFERCDGLKKRRIPGSQVQEDDLGN